MAKAKKATGKTKSKKATRAGTAKNAPAARPPVPPKKQPAPRVGETAESMAKRQR